MRRMGRAESDAALGRSRRAEAVLYWASESGKNVHAAPNFNLAQCARRLSSALRPIKYVLHVCLCFYFGLMHN